MLGICAANNPEHDTADDQKKDEKRNDSFFHVKYPDLIWFTLALRIWQIPDIVGKIGAIQRLNPVDVPDVNLMRGRIVRLT